MANIFTINGDRLTPMAERCPEKEDVLHGHLEKFPLVIAEALDPENPPKFIVLKREAGVVGFSMDLLLLEQSYALTIVEAKRAENTDLRRKIIGQGIEYAANLVTEWNTGEIIAQAKKYWKDKGKELLEEINSTFREEPIMDDETLIQKVGEKLGNLQIVFAVDGPLPNELKTAIEFLNKNFKSIRVYGLEVRYFGEEKGQQIVAPLLIGRTAEAEVGKPTKHTKWTEKMFRSELEKEWQNDPEMIKVVEELLKFSEQRGSKDPFDKGPTKDACFDFFVKEGDKHSALLYVTTRWIYSCLTNRPRFREALVKIGFDVSTVKEGKWCDLDVLKDHNKMESFKNAVLEVIQGKTLKR